MYKKAKLRQWLKSLDNPLIRNQIQKMHSLDIANILKVLSKRDIEKLVHNLPDSMLGEVLLRLGSDLRNTILELIDSSKIFQMIGGLDSNDRKMILDALSEERRKVIFSWMPLKEVRELEELLKSKKDTAGWIMGKELLVVQKDQNIEEVIEILRKKADEIQDIYVMFVVDESGCLVGYVSLKRLILAFYKNKVEQIMKKDVVSVRVDMDQEQVAYIAKQYDIASVAVVDELGVLVGRITFDNLMDVMDKEATEDINQLAGLSQEKSRWFGRLPWLLMGFAGGILIVWIMGRFGSELDNLLTLSFFTPMILSMGGSIGIQTSTVVLRSLALGEVYVSNTYQYVVKEIKNTLLNGFICSCFLFTAGFLYLDIQLGYILGVSLFAVMNISGFLGVMIPLVLKRLNTDPAVASGPLMSILNDFIALLVYFGIASIILTK